MFAVKTQLFSNLAPHEPERVNDCETAGLLI